MIEKIKEVYIRINNELNSKYPSGRFNSKDYRIEFKQLLEK